MRSSPGSLNAENKASTDENAQAAYDKLASMVTGTVYGEEAAAAYANGGGAYNCSFTEGLSTLEFDGASSTIKGYSADGSELDALGQYDAGDYVYWLASSISTDCDQAMIENCIQLFCTENLSE